MAPLVLAVLLAIVADPSAAQTVTVQAPPAKAQTSSAKDPNKIVCRSEEQAGSNIRVRTCKTQSQWDSQDEQARQYFEDAQSRGALTNGPTNPMAPVR